VKPDDLIVTMEQKRYDAEQRYNRNVEAVKQYGGTVTTLAKTRWESAHCVEVDIQLD
jgi:hypothetical protein